MFLAFSLIRSYSLPTSVATIGTVASEGPSPAVVRSPGHRPQGVTLDCIAQQSVPRNVLTMRALRCFGVAEDAGRGVDLVRVSVGSLPVAWELGLRREGLWKSKHNPHD